MPVVVHPDGPTGPYRPSAKVRNCSNLRIETGNASLRRAFRQNDQRPLTIGFDYGDLASTSYSQPELSRFITNPHNNDTRSVDELARDKAGEDNDVREDNQQSGGDYSEDEEGDNEEVQNESEESEESD
ncbi:hypothetical protein Tco_1454701 [Tanacetum coccineum]